jgi:protease-4
MNESAPPPRRSTAAFWIVIVLLALSLGVSVLVNIGLGTALFATASGHLDAGEEVAVDQFPTFDEEWSYGSGTTKVVRLELVGFITREAEGGLWEPVYDPVGSLIRGIRAARADDEVAAILLEIDSPGGGVTPSDELYHELMQFKQSREGRKVVVLMRDLAASGGYYVAMAGDWLIAQPTALIGSIGVIMQTLNWKPLSDRIGISDVTIKSGENKDLLNPFRETRDEELAILQAVINQTHHRFRGIVGETRGFDEATLATLADGRIFSADDALSLRLIDEIGYWSEAVDRTSALLGVDDVRIVRYYESTSFWDFFTRIRAPRLDPLAAMRQSPARLEYRWKP